MTSAWMSVSVTDQTISNREVFYSTDVIQG
jgi:hypothetical protein